MDPSKDGHYTEILAGVGVHQQLDLSVDGVNRDYRPLEGHAPERLDLLHVTNPLVQQLFRYLVIPVELQLTELMQVKFESRSDGRGQAERVEHSRD